MAKKRKPDYISYLTDAIYNEMMKCGDCSNAYQDAMSSIDDGFPMYVEIKFLNPMLDTNKLIL